MGPVWNVRASGRASFVSFACVSNTVCMMTNFSSYTWDGLREKIGLEGANAELDKRITGIFNTLRDITSVTSMNSLTQKVRELKYSWFPAIDQYERTILHLAALNGNTRLVCALVDSGARINAKDGIGQSPLTLALHMDHSNTAKQLIERGAAVNDIFFESTVPPIEIARVKKNAALVTLIECKIKEEKTVIEKVGAYFAENIPNDHSSAVNEEANHLHARQLNINVGDQKNTVTIQGCVNRCPDVYTCHTPGGGDFHARGYVNESIARIAGQGGFWHVTEHIMKRPTVNPASFKNKFKVNNYNNNEEALLDFDDGLSIAMVKTFEESMFFPSTDELDDCLKRTNSHNEILLKSFEEWVSFSCQNDEQFQYHSHIINDLMPITRWYKESIRNGNGVALEGVWMLCPALFTSVAKTNYRDEAFTHVVNSIAKWPLAYRKLYQQNRTVNLDGKQGRQLAGDEWVEEFLVRPIKQYASAQSSFAMVELMSCNTNLLEMIRTMYKSRDAFDIHNTNKHKRPSSVHDQFKVAQFALKEQWFEEKGRKTVLKYPWADKKFKPGDLVSPRYINSYQKGCEKAKIEFPGFLHRKYPNDML